ncbi:MAG: hypothetical protein M1829_001477 [Trizodia sp. TS-e1964]|nr:MAG: hypothetical protein M1829_001477 [Trizodia sp. TS-e1964]
MPALKRVKGDAAPDTAGSFGNPSNRLPLTLAATGRASFGPSLALQGMHNKSQWPPAPPRAPRRSIRGLPPRPRRVLPLPSRHAPVNAPESGLAATPAVAAKITTKQAVASPRREKSKEIFSMAGRAPPSAPSDKKL